MWQKSRSSTSLTYREAQAYIKNLNHQRFVGYSDWRLPTIAELMSLLESEKQASDLYVNPIFTGTQGWCWSSDKRLSESVWLVSFEFGRVHWGNLYYFVRVVRP